MTHTLSASFCMDHPGNRNNNAIVKLYGPWQYCSQGSIYERHMTHDNPAAGERIYLARQPRAISTSHPHHPPLSPSFPLFPLPSLSSSHSTWKLNWLKHTVRAFQPRQGRASAADCFGVDYLFKVIVIGESGTGKSCLLWHFIHDQCEYFLPRR